MSKFKRNTKVKELYKKLHNGKIKIVAGVRRCGKTYLLDTLFYEYVSEKDKLGKNSFTKIYLTGKHKKYKSEELFRSLLKTIADSNPEIIFIDEVQEAENYHKALKDFIYDYPNIDLYVTGSNSNTLSADIVESFKELADIVYLYPLTFKEIRAVKKTYSLLDYLKYGGLPTVVNTKSKDNEIDYICKQIYQLDIVDRAKKENFLYLLKEDMDSIMSNLFSGSTPFSAVRVVDEMCKHYGFDKSQKAQLRREVKDYLDIVTKSFLFSPFDNESYGRKTPLEMIGLNKKYYCCDSGIAYEQCKVPNHKLTSALETAVFLHLKQNKIDSTGLLIIGEKNNVEGEIDFNYSGNHVQVAYSLTGDNFDREIGNLVAINDDCKKFLIYVEILTDTSRIDKSINVIQAEAFLTSLLK